MTPTLLSLLTGLVSGAITAVVTYFATVAKTRLDLSVEYDKELRTQRLLQYTALWKLLKPLARYAAEKPITYAIVKATSESMRDWYFDEGGIYLSRASRGPYFALKQVMQTIIDDATLRQQPDTPLPSSRLAALHQRGTVLRDTLSNDIGTRREPLLRAG